jgi:hypothetical protein
MQFRNDIGDGVADARYFRQPVLLDQAIKRDGERRGAIGRRRISLGALGIAATQRSALCIFAKRSGDLWGIGFRHVSGHPLFPQRQPLDHFDGMGGASPAQEFDFLVFECVRSPEKLFQLIARARR